MVQAAMDADDEWRRERLRKWMDGLRSAPGLRKLRFNYNPVDPRTGRPWVPSNKALPMPWADNGDYFGAWRPW